MLFNEELGAVIQVSESKLSSVREVLKAHDLLGLTYELGSVSLEDRFEITRGSKNY